MTIHDLAKAAGVNSSTVSRALRNDPRVRESTRERIKALALKYGYTPNLNARNLAGGKTRMIAFLMGSLEYQLEREVAVLLNELFSRHGYTLMIFSYAPEKEKFYMDRLEKLTQKICDGAILFAPDYKQMTPELFALLKKVRIPLVCLDRWFDKLPIPAVTTDSTAAAELLVDATMQAGMDAAILGLKCANSTSSGRNEAFIKQLKQRGIPFCVPETPEEFTVFLHETRSVKPAVFCDNAVDFPTWVPHLPAGFITAGFDLRLPTENRQYFGNIFLCIQDFPAIARKSAQLLLDQLENGNNFTSAGNLVVIPPAKLIRF